MPYRPKPHRPRSLPMPERLRRGTSAQRGYNSRWRRLRRAFLNSRPCCADPFGVHAAERRVVPAAHVDHIVPLSAGGTNDEDNLQPLCVTCHARKTVLCDGGFGRARQVVARATRGGVDDPRTNGET